MSHYLQDILAEPTELRRSLDFTLGEGVANLRRAADIVRGARMIYITGIGSSWHAGMAVQSIFDAAARPAMLVDASELLHAVRFAPDSCLIALSRSGKSVEIVKLLEKADAAGVRVIAVTNTPDSPLGHRAAVTLPLQARFDHNVSITMYSALTLTGGLLAAEATTGIAPALQSTLRGFLTQAQQRLESWRDKIERSEWFDQKVPTYFLARGGSLASCHEARLLWEEAAKVAATAMTTGGFRHGPQEMLLNGARIGLWLSPTALREQDLNLVRDLRHRGVAVMLIGQHLPDDVDCLALDIPPLSAEFCIWQFLSDIIPAQLASAHLARQLGADSDGFSICPYIIESEGGLVSPGSAVAPSHA
jgi:fructoselysine-6-P-deglycase FrlB-like protein